MGSSPVTHVPLTKRRKINDDLSNLEAPTDHLASNSLRRPISPPRLKRSASSTASNAPASVLRGTPDKDLGHKFVSSPIQLTRIDDLMPSQNVDTIGLKDILGDPLIKECWNFNFLFDLDFVMQHFDHDVRALVKLKIIHGFWKRDDAMRINLLQTAERYPNIELLSAYMPDPFGTHHSKIMILFRHDETAQIIIHTANMIYRDWTNMTQAVWSSPLLPLRALKKSSGGAADDIGHPIGNGKRFQTDLIQYFAAYERRTKDLISQLQDYVFSAIKAAFIGSAPSRQKPGAADPSKKTSFGWPGLKEILSQVSIPSQVDATSPPHIVTQISSIATLGAQPTWITHFHGVLAQEPSDSKVMTNHLPKSRKTHSIFSKRELTRPKPAKFSVIFPTPEEIRSSLDGYASGGSIHWKLQSPQQQKQLEYMHPWLCHWNPPPTSNLQDGNRNSHRGLAAPHVKTYIRFSDEEENTIDWAMITSANLSRQAWGDVVNKKEEVWIQSWEAGVVVWPALFDEAVEGVESAGAIMVPVFGKNLPVTGDIPQIHHAGTAADNCGGKLPATFVGLRMPYNLPLHQYAADEKPWCATMKYGEPDWKGQTWEGY